MRRMGWWAAMAVALTISGAVNAQDAYAAVGACDEEAVATESVRSKATIELSGVADVGVWARHVEARTPAGQRVNYSTTDFAADSANLTFKVTPTGFENNFLTMTLDLDDAWDGSFDQDDFLKELYFTFDNICNTGFGVKFGKMQVPYGYDKDVLLVSPYLDGKGETSFAWVPAYDPANIPNNEGHNLIAPFGDYAAFNNFGHPTNVDETFAITPYWNICDSLLVEASLFQRAGSRDINGRRRSNDNLLFKSMALAFTWTPCENLTVKVSGITEYIDAGKNSFPGATDRAYGLSAAVDYTFTLCGREINAFVEYQHGWNYLDLADLTGFNFGFDDSASSDNVHFGTATKICDRLTLHSQAEYLRIKHGNRGSNTAWRSVMALQYEMASGIVLEGGWQHEWLTVKTRGVGGTKRKYDADTIFAGVRYTF